MIGIINNLFIIQEFYVVGVRQNANNAYKEDVLEVVFYNCPHLSNGLVVKKKIKSFIDKFFNQAGTFC